MQVAHHGVKFHHAVADRGSGGKHHAFPSGQIVQIPALGKHITGFLGFGLPDSGNIPHFCCEEKIFKPMCLVHKQLIHAQFLKSDHIILAALVI